MQAVFTIPLSDLNQELIEKIKSLFKGNGEQMEVVISIGQPPRAIKIETREEFFARLERAKDAIENRRDLVSFSLEEFEEAFPSK